MHGKAQARLLGERSIETADSRGGERVKDAVRSVTINLTESPLGWLLARGLVRGASMTPANDSAATGNARNWRRG